MTIVGEKMIISAPTVNLHIVDATNWTVLKTIKVEMPGNILASPKTHTVSLKVIPCAITASVIPSMTTSIGNKIEATFPAFTYTHFESTLDLCGPIEYEVGTDPYIIINSVSRTMTYYPRSNVYQGVQKAIIKAKSSLFPLNTIEAEVILTGIAPCVTNSYLATPPQDAAGIPVVI